MLLGRFEVAGLFVQFLCDGQVGLLEEAGSELGDQPDHVVVLLAFFVLMCHFPRTFLIKRIYRSFVAVHVIEIT